MDNRIDRRFAKLKQDKRTGLITFLMAGDPDREKSLEALLSLPAAGADLIEIGMPFSDPMADGPAIQAAAERSLAAGGDLNLTLDMVKALRQKDTETPVILMGYYNPIHHYGPARFAENASKAGVDGLIVVDLPPEEDSEMYGPARNAGLHVIRLVTPVTTAERLDTILQRAGGFLYYVSITGVTGTAQAQHQDVRTSIAAIRRQTNLPVAVGFGIRTPDDTAAFSGHADAVVVGSAIVNTIAAMVTGEAKPNALTTQVKALAKALR